MNEKMKIALCCPASLPATQFGGIMFLAVDIARELSKNGNNVSIFTTDLDFGNGPKKFNKELPRCELVDKFTIYRSHVWLSINLFFINPGMYFQLLNNDVDIIHTIGLRSFQSFVAALIAKRKKIPLIISDQGGLTTHPELNDASIMRKFLYKIQNIMIKFIVNQSTKISVANEYEKKIFEKFDNKNKSIIIKNGINLEELDSKNIYLKKKYNIEKKFILFLGRFHKVKGVDILINAIKKIKDEQMELDFKVVIMGADFGYEKQMLELIKKLKLENELLIIRNPQREEVIAAYKECEFLVLPSRWELSPLTPLEGFAFKKPVISTNVHGIPSTIQNNKNGILVPSEDVTTLANAIMELLENKQKRDEMGNEGYQLVKNICNSRIMAERTFEIYQEAINNSK